VTVKKYCTVFSVGIRYSTLEPVCEDHYCSLPTTLVSHSVLAFVLFEIHSQKKPSDTNSGGFFSYATCSIFAGF